ncbi:MAG TPA: hypothetical protein VMS92_22910 [Mycobacterium sp.]|nr:hypothetical protein [Mycobacterium sp.]
MNSVDAGGLLDAAGEWVISDGEYNICPCNPVDAALIAAAPELLAMLERAQEWLDAGDGPTPPLSSDIAALLIRLRGLKHP